MACYSPLTAFRTAEDTKLVFTPGGDVISSLWVPCGQCIGCKLENSRQKALRGTLEAKMHAENSWLTITYDQENLGDGNLSKRDLDLLIKRIRRKYDQNNLSHLSCGEYGSHTDRMHFHSCLFGLDFADKYKWKNTGNGYLYRSPELEKLWDKGHILIGELNWDTVAYTARYVTKKLTGKNAGRTKTGKVPEFGSMSRRPAVGKRFIEEYFSDIYPKDFVTVRGRKMKPPIYFDRYLEKENPEMYREVKERREKFARRNNTDLQKTGRAKQVAEIYIRKIRKQNDSPLIHHL